MQEKENLIHKKPFSLLKHDIILIIFAMLPVALAAIIAYMQFIRVTAQKEAQLVSIAAQEKVKQQELMQAKEYIASVEGALTQTIADLDNLKNEDQVLINKNLLSELTNIQTTYKDAVTTYEDLVELKPKLKKTDELDKQYAKILSLLGSRSYATASAQLKTLKTTITTEQGKLSQSFSIAANVAASNSAPLNGYSRQKVNANGGDYLVDIVAADMNTYKVVVDTASDGDCGNDCSVKPLGEYVARSGAMAGINGGYFCPASYPSCTGKTNSFDTLVKNKNGKLFNESNNVYSTVPGVGFFDSSMRFYSQTVNYGKDGNSYLANRPLLLLGGNVLGNADDAKQTSKGPRAFVGNKGNMAYIGIVSNASVYEAAMVLKTLGFDNALNLDSGGSTALWANGAYKAGPGRAIPNAILFVKK
jgi:exopolysaccharide biosynthesis protein